MLFEGEEAEGMHLISVDEICGVEKKGGRKLDFA
jgi:hypothetical protein